MGLLSTAVSTGSEASDAASAMASIGASTTLGNQMSAFEANESFSMNAQEAKTKFEENAGKLLSDAASMGGQ